jgi:hypothetical protein
MSLRAQTGELQTCVVNDLALEAIRESEQFMLLTNEEPETIEWQMVPSNFWALTKTVAATASFSCYVVLSDQDWASFRQFVAQWHKERGTASSPVYMAMCPSYQRIMSMGPERAIPLILKQLELEGDDPDHWFWALHYLANADPVHPDDRGNMKKMSAAWIRWGQENWNAR